MPDDDLLDVHAEQLIDFMIQVLHFRRRIMTMLPEDIHRLRARLEKAQLTDELRCIPTPNDLYYRATVAVLSRCEAPISMGELSKWLDIPLSTTTRVMDGLVETGVVERVADPTDRRVVRVALTENGRKIHETLNDFMRQRIAHLMRGLSVDERSQLMTLLRKVLGAMAEDDQ